MDIEILKTQVEGIKAKGEKLREKEKLFLKASGLEEEAEKAKKKILDNESELEVIKEEIKSLTAKKNAAVSKSITAVSEKMAEALPDGMPVFEITEDGTLIIGWDLDGFRPYEGLSGGEKVSFDNALAHALNAGILILEGAEIDDETIVDTMGMLSRIEKQVMLCTCHEPATIPDGWEIIRLGKEVAE